MHAYTTHTECSNTIGTQRSSKKDNSVKSILKSEVHASFDVGN